MSDDQARAWQMMAELDFCMLVTKPANGLRGRPMSSIVKEDEGKIYFLSDVHGAKDEEIAKDPHILLCYGDGKSKFVSTAAAATLKTDRALVERLWNPGAQAFWPKGPSDANVVVIEAIPTQAEYWDGAGTIVSSVKFAFAVLTGTTPTMGDNAKVGL